jgi:hypothetical protein
MSLHEKQAKREKKEKKKKTNKKKGWDVGVTHKL